MMPFRKIAAASKGHLIRKYFTENSKRGLVAVLRG